MSSNYSIHPGSRRPLLHVRVSTSLDRALLCAGIIDANQRIFATTAPPLDAGGARFPHNAVCAWADTWRHRSAGRRKQEAAAAEFLVRCAPRNPEAWLALGSSIRESANRIRKARYTSQMTESGLRTISQIYDHRVPPLRRATQLDPALGRAWHRLAAAATFFRASRGGGQGRFSWTQSV